jgi:hypothetical protein
VPIDHENLKEQEKVLALCKAVGGTHYVNPIGGVKLYDQEGFRARGLRLSFLESGDVRYAQFDHPFVANLSILDVMMFNDLERLRELLQLYKLN